MKPEDRARLDDWYFWQGIAGLWYAKRIKSSPPHIKRDVNRTRLERRIVEGEPPPWQSG